MPFFALNTAQLLFPLIASAAQLSFAHSAGLRQTAFLVSAPLRTPHRRLLGPGASGGGGSSPSPTSTPLFLRGDFVSRDEEDKHSRRGFCDLPTTKKRPSIFGTTAARTTMMNAAENGGGATPPKARVLGVCGGIGSGKSTACKLLVGSVGCLAHIDADSLAHGVYEPGCQAMKEIVSEFGRGIVTSENENEGDENEVIDRKALGAIVFSDPSAMAKLEQIVWPHVREAIEARIDEIRLAAETVTEHTATAADGSDVKNLDIIVVEAAILLDTDWGDLFDGTWVVRSSESTSTQRLVESRGMSEEDALKRIEAQKPRRGIGNLESEVEKGFVTAVIDNDGALFDLQEALEKAMANPKSFRDGVPALVKR